MTGVSVCVRFLLVLLCGRFAAAQLLRAESLQHAWAAQPIGSSAWFATGFDLIEAWFDNDVRRAREVAEKLWQAGERDPLVSAATRVTSAAYAALCAVRLDGVPAAAPWLPRIGEGLPEDAPDPLRARFHLAVMRRQATEADEFAVLMAAVAAREAARKSQVPDLQLLTSLVVHSLGSPGQRHVDAALASAQQIVQRDESAYLAPWVHYHEHISYENLGNTAATARCGDLAEQSAERLGNSRVAVLMARSRATDAGRAQQLDAARDHVRRAVALARELGDCDVLARALEFLADIEVMRADIRSADAAVTEGLAMLVGKGLERTELGLLRTERTVALRLADGERAKAIDARIAVLAANDAAAHPWQQIAQMRELLARDENAALDAVDRRIADERAAAERRRSLFAIGAGVVALALAAVSVVSLRSRRRLVAMNRRLREEMQRNEEEQAARSRLEERVRQLERMESLDMMARGIAHDLNNLMVGVLGNAEILAPLVADDDQRSRVQAITASGQRAARMCKQLQAYAGNMPLALRTLDVNKVIAGMLPVLRAATGDEVQLEQVPASRRLAVHGDQSQVEQVLLNLVQNARDAGARHVSITAEAIELDAVALAARRLRGEPAPGRYVEITVADDGSGMPEDVAGRVFDPFFTTRFPGRGLGLAVVLGIVRRHGGAVDLDSAPGRGSRFKVLLPATMAATEIDTAVIDLSTLAVASGQSVLVVDDEAAVRDYVSVALGRRGFAVTQATGGEDALAKLAAGAKPDVILLDVTMPGIDGIETLRQLRAGFPGTKVVLMSGHGESYLKDASADVAPDAILPKPFTAAGLLVALNSCSPPLANGSARPVRRDGALPTRASAAAERSGQGKVGDAGARAGKP